MNNFKTRIMNVEKIIKTDENNTLSNEEEFYDYNKKNYGDSGDGGITKSPFVKLPGGFETIWTESKIASDPKGYIEFLREQLKIADTEDLMRSICEVIEATKEIYLSSETEEYIHKKR